MAALAKKNSSVEGASGWRGRSVRAAHEADQPQPSAVRLQHAMLEAAFSESTVKPYPGPVKVAILIGAPLAFWVGAFALATRLIHA